MNLVESLLGYRSFASESEIRRSIEQSKYYDSSKESPEEAGSLLIFDTSRQHTWLVATGERLYFIRVRLFLVGGPEAQGICERHERTT